MENNLNQPESSTTPTPPVNPSSDGEVRTIGDIAESIMARIKSESPEQAELRERAEQEAVERQNTAERQKRWRDLVSQFGRRYEGAKLSNFDTQNDQQRAVVELLREFAEKIGDSINACRNLVLYGPRGTGKDHLLVAMLRAAIADGWTVAWRDGQSLYGELRDAIDQDKSEAKLLEQFTAPNVLAISDPTPPGGEIKSDYQKSMLFRIIDRRYRDLKPTWVTINAEDAKDAEKKIAPNIIDRLMHDALILRCNWKSYRSGR